MESINSKTHMSEKSIQTEENKIEETAIHAEKKPITGSSLLKFIVPSLIGLFLFIVPIPYDGSYNIGFGIITDYISSNVEVWMPMFLMLAITASALISTGFAISKKKSNNVFINELFIVEPMWLSFRILGAFFTVLTFFNVGPAFITSGDTGGTMLFGLLPSLVVLFLFAGLFLPLLTEFGLMDFIGTMIKSVMRPLFKVPGRSAIDAVASWLGGNAVGVIITSKQYKEGYYTAKEAAIIASSFSLVSLPFSLVIASSLGLQHMFLQFYGVICIASIVAALIIPRIKPISTMSEKYTVKNLKRNEEITPEEAAMSTYGVAVKRATDKAVTAKPAQLAIDAVKVVVDIYVGLLPLIMAWGTLSLIIAEYTPIFNLLSYPLIPLLNLMNIPAAEVAAPALLVGFADMFLPAILVAEVPYEITRFVIGAVSISQLIFMTETGAVILKSEIPLKLKDLFIIFIERTLITLPIIVLFAHMIY